MKLYKKLVLPRDIDERRELVSGLVGKTVLVNDSVVQRQFDMEGTISLSDKGSNKYYFLRIEGTRKSVVLNYYNIREIRVRVKFAESFEEGVLEQAYP